MPSEVETGSLAWGQRTGGRLSCAQMASFATRSIPALATLLRSHAQLRLTRRGGRHPVDPNTMKVPDTLLCQSAAHCAQRHYGDGALQRHAYRTIAYAHAIAKIENLDVDPELLWCACLLHDIGLPHPVASQCFAVRGALIAHDLAIDAHTAPPRADQLAEAISRHPAPGLDPHTQPLAYLVNAGALLDLTGSRLERLNPQTVNDLLSRQTRAGLEQILTKQWAAEATHVSRGRASVARALGFLTAARCAPYPRAQK